MTIPDYQSLMLPVLKFAGDGQEHALRETIEALGAELGLSDEEMKELLPSGYQSIFDNRVGWARTYLKKAGLLKSTKRGFVAITERGRETLAANPSKINVKFLEKFPEFVEFRSKSSKATNNTVAAAEPTADAETPEESLGYLQQRLKEDLAEELLLQVKSSSPQFFEKLVVELLVKMGYGGSRKDAGQAIGRSGDEGIDGIIKEDRLGLDAIYIQAKKWEGSIGRPELQKFAGALQGQRARKGVFITTSSFTKEACNFVANIENKIVLIDGIKLTQLMIDAGIGVSTVNIYEIKKIDSDYFDD